jgi:tetratricopeptide (TPR) repeat protein
LEQAYKLEVARQGPDGPAAVDTLLQMGLAYTATGQTDKAVDAFERVLATYRARPAHRAEEREVLGYLADANEAAGRYDQAVARWREVVDLCRAERAADDLPRALYDLGHALDRAGRPAEAEPPLREALGLYERGDDWFRFVALGELGRCLTGLKKYDEAEKELLTSVRELRQREGKDITRGPLAGEGEDGWVAQAVDALIALYVQWGKPDEARKWRAQRPAARPVAPAPRPK